MNGVLSRLERGFVSAALALAILCLSGCAKNPLDCGGDAALRKIRSLFGRQLKITPYARFIDVDKAKLKITAIRTIAAAGTQSTCVALAVYDAALNEAGARAKDHDALLYNFIYELDGEKLIYYRVLRDDDGRVEVRLDRVGG